MDIPATPPPAPDSHRPLRMIFIHLFLVVILTIGAEGAVSFWASKFNYAQAQRTELSKTPHDIVIIGNSLTHANLNAQLLSGYMSKSVIAYYSDGAAAGWWYLALKNIVLKLEPKPRVILVPLLPRYVTNPYFGIQEYIKEPIAETDEPVFDAFLKMQKSTNYMENFLARHSATYRESEQLRRRIYEGIRDAIAVRMQIKGQTDRAMNQALKDIDLKRSPGAAMPKVSPKNWSIENTFIPSMVTLSQEYDVPIIFIRLKERYLAQGSADEDPDFSAVLSEYLSKNDMVFLDYSADARLEKADFKDERHLTNNAQKKFNAILANDIRHYLK